MWVAERTQHHLRVIDVREPFETLAEGAGHIPGSESIPLNQLPGMAAHWPREVAIVIVDADGSLAPHAVTKLRSLGFSDVVWMTGGMGAWRSAGLPIAFTPEAELAHAE